MKIIFWALLLPLLYLVLNYEAATNISVDSETEAAVWKVEIEELETGVLVDAVTINHEAAVSKETEVVENLDSEVSVDAVTINHEAAVSKETEVVENLETEVIITEIIGKDYRGYEALVVNPGSIMVTDRRESTLKAFESSRALFAVNGGGFVGREPIGNTVIDGELKGSFRPTNHNWDIFIGFDGENSLVGGRVDSYKALRDMNPVYGVSFGPALVVEGEPRHTESRDLHPRTAVGQLECGSLLFIVIDGRQPGWSRGITINDLRDLFIERGAVNAYNLDGGGSSAMIYEGRVLNRPSDGRLRLVANNIIVRQ